MSSQIIENATMRLDDNDASPMDFGQLLEKLYHNLIYGGLIIVFCWLVVKKIYGVFKFALNALAYIAAITIILGAYRGGQDLYESRQR